jgi:mono/diheme cytochrome c family protein
MSARQHLLAAALAVATLAGIGAAKAAPDNFTEVERGRYLTKLGDCMACHIGQDGKSLAGGRQLETPFGNISVPNISPDVDTGIGHWTADDFYKAMHEGVGPNGKHLYPAFPYTSFTLMPRYDVDAVYAYLRTLPPVNNQVDRDTLPFPFNIRLLMAGWNLLNFTPGEFKPDPQKSAEYNRGAYLVEGPAHCALCHTARDMVGGARTGAYLQGGELQGWFAPNITPDKRLGIGDWSQDEIVTYLRTGHTTRAAASGPMAEVVAFSTSQMTAPDLKAIAVYLQEQSVPNVATPAALAATDARMQTGEAIYADTCAACHAGSGGGADGMFPRLANNQVVQQDDPTTILRVVLQGAQSVATPLAPTAPSMPSLGWRLNDQQVADVSTYIRNAWGNAASAVTPEAVRKMRDTVAERPH